MLTLSQLLPLVLQAKRKHYSDDIIPVEMIAAIVELCKRDLLLQGRMLNCLVLKRTMVSDCFDLGPEQYRRFPLEDELVAHLKLIKFYAKHCDIRYQIIYNLFNHWDVMDCQITSGKVSFVLLDTNSQVDIVLFAVTTIRRIIPDAEITILVINTQSDGNNCVIFAIQNMLHLATLENLHTELVLSYQADSCSPPVSESTYAASVAYYLGAIFRPPDSLDPELDGVRKMMETLIILLGIYQYEYRPACYQNIRFVSGGFLPEFAPLFQYMQSTQRFFSLPQAVLTFWINSDNNQKQPLQICFKSSLKPARQFGIFIKENPAKLINVRILIKKQQILERLYTFLQKLSDSEYNLLQTNRIKLLFPFTRAHFLVVPDIKEHYKAGGKVNRQAYLSLKPNDAS